LINASRFICSFICEYFSKNFRFSLSQQYGFKPVRGQSLINFVASDFESGWKSYICVESCQRLLSQLLCPRMQSAQAVRPTPNNYDLTSHGLRDSTSRANEANSGCRIHAWALSRKYPSTEEIGLIFPTRRMIRDLKPHLQNIAGRYAIAFYCRAEDCLWIFTSPD